MKVAKNLQLLMEFTQQPVTHPDEQYKTESQTMQITNKKSIRKSRGQTVEHILDAISLHEKIEARAHEIYLTHGSKPGHELDDWLQAEREIMGWI